MNTIHLQNNMTSKEWNELRPGDILRALYSGHRVRVVGFGSKTKHGAKKVVLVEVDHDSFEACEPMIYEMVTPNDK